MNSFLNYFDPSTLKNTLKSTIPFFLLLCLAILAVWGNNFLSTDKVPKSEQPLNTSGNPTDILSLVNTIPTLKTSQLDISKTVINIICEIPDGDRPMRSISSSGVIISDSGLILTNAHVGIHAFLDEYTNRAENCIAKSGSPSETTWPISLVYISPDWTARHPGEIHGALNPDTGESDFAILKISHIDNEHTQSIPLKNLSLGNIALFGKKTLNTENYLKIDQKLTLVAYPVGENMIFSPNTKQELEDLSINRIQTFVKNDTMATNQTLNPESIPRPKPIDATDHNTDLIVTSLGKIGRSGSSGGAMIDESKHLVGIVTNIIRPPEEDGSMNHGTYARGISISHIDNELTEQSGLSIYDLVRTDGANLKAIFESKYQEQVKKDLLINFIEF